MKQYAITQVTVAPIRAENSDKSEMVSQLIFGEKVEIIERKNQWVFIKTCYDDYNGWIDEKHIIETSNNNDSSLGYIPKPFDYIKLSENNFPVTIGAEIPQELNISYTGELINNKESNKNLILEYANLYINTPYLWGGKSTYGIDCSGFTQMCYKLAGIYLPRDAYQQAECGEVLSFLEEAAAGDLAFFENSEGRIIHVGIILEQGKIIHAHGQVRIDKLDYTGIFNEEKKYYSHKLRLIRHIK